MGARMFEQTKIAKWPHEPATLYLVDVTGDIKRTAGDDLDDLIAPLIADSRLERLLQYVLQHLSEPLPAHKAAERVSVEKKYFSKFFRKQTGYNFAWWNREIRMRLAKRMFHQRGTIHAVALAVGYPNLTTFERAFKKSTAGMSPRAYHRSHALALKSSDIVQS